MQQPFFNIEANSLYPVSNLPLGIISHDKQLTPHVAVRIGEFALDLFILAKNNLLPNQIDISIFNQPTLNKLMSLDKKDIITLRAALSKLITGEIATLKDSPAILSEALIPLSGITTHMPVAVGDYTDFYSSIQHATNIGKMFRPDNPLLPNWKHLPVAYHGRASSLIVSNTPIHRPSGQILPTEKETPIFSKTQKLDIELEMGFYISRATTLGTQVSTQNALDHIFGFSLVNDWSARDIQKWEYVPLGPFLAKSFATSVAAWITPLQALQPYRVLMPEQTPAPLAYLAMPERYSFDIHLEVSIKTNQMQHFETISKTNYQNIYWSIEQQLAHHTVNGCNLNTGDLMASGTISGESPDSYGSLLELAWGGKKPLTLSNGEERIFLQDGDTIQLSGYCQNQQSKIGLAEVIGTITA